MKTIQLLSISALFSCLLFTVNGELQSFSLNKKWDFKGASLWEESIEEVVDQSCYSSFTRNGFLDATFACKKASSISKESIGDYDTCYRNTIIINNGGRTNSWRKLGYKLF